MKLRYSLGVWLFLRQSGLSQGGGLRHGIRRWDKRMQLLTETGNTAGAGISGDLAAMLG